MKRLLFPLFAFDLFAGAGGIAATAWRRRTHGPLPQIHKVLIISVDGLRPDLALRQYADDPQFDCHRLV